MFCWAIVHGSSASGAAAMRRLGLMTSAVNPLAAAEEALDVTRYLKAL